MPDGAKMQPKGFAHGPQGRVDLGSQSACYLPAYTLSHSRFGFAVFSFLKEDSILDPSLSSPFPSLVGRVLVTLRLPFGWVWVVFLLLMGTDGAPCLSEILRFV